MGIQGEGGQVKAERGDIGKRRGGRGGQTGWSFPGATPKQTPTFGQTLVFAPRLTRLDINLKHEHDFVQMMSPTTVLNSHQQEKLLEESKAEVWLGRNQS